MQRHLLLLPAIFLLAACGQTGGLYLPDEGVTTPVEIRPAPTTAPPAPATEQPQEREEDGEDGQNGEPPPPGTGD
jgi:predicted small lipoprotein YifL